MMKYYVLYPVREYEDTAELIEFDTREEAIKAVNDDLKKDYDFEVAFDEYRIIKGIELKLIERTKITEITVVGEN